MKEVWRVLRGHRTRFAVITAAEAAMGGIEAFVHPLLLKALFDEAIAARDFRRFLILGACYLTVGLALNLGSYAVSSWRKRCENSFMLLLEMELLERSLGLDSREVSENGNASYVSRVHNDVAEGVLPAVDLCVRIARLSVSSVVFLGVLLYLSWQASLILLVVMPPLILVSNRLAKRIEDNTEPEREAEAQYINTVTRTLEAFHALRGLPKLRPAVQEGNRRALGGFLDIVLANFRLALKQSTLSELVMNLSDTASMVTGAYFVFAGRMSVGSFLAFVNSLWRAVTGVFEVINMIPQVRRNAAVLRRIEALRLSEPAHYYREGRSVLVSGARVDYPEGATVSVDDFELQAGEHVLLRGPNGSGKTTLLHILTGTLAPDEGTVTLPLRIASLTAPVNLPPIPVRDLVADERLRTALNLEPLANQLPAELSSGQRQRVGIAALLSEDADLYVADEPFANLDEQSRGVLLEALNEQTRGRGLLVVHHGDEDLNEHFDRIVTLAKAEASYAC